MVKVIHGQCTIPQEVHHSYGFYLHSGRICGQYMQHVDLISLTIHLYGLCTYYALVEFSVALNFIGSQWHNLDTNTLVNITTARQWITEDTAITCVY